MPNIPIIFEIRYQYNKNQRLSMNYHLSEIFNIEELKHLCESFTKLNGTVTAILDLEGNVYVATGWQPICTQFHRINPETSKRCTESDTVLASQLQQGKNYNVYKCKNGLIDVAMPITVGGVHVGNFFTGQFFDKKPDINFFIKQAEEFGFDKDVYLSVVEKVPVFNDEQVKNSIEFLVQLTETIGNMGLKNIQILEGAKQLELEKKKIQESYEEYATLYEEYKTLNEELQVSKEKAEDSDRLKSAFLANMSHEIRTPLNGILGFTQLLSEKSTSEAEKQEYIRIIHNCGNQLLSIISDIIDIAKIEANQLQIFQNSVHINNLLSTTYKLFSERFKSKNIELSYSYDLDDDKSIILTDNYRLQQILNNLLTNAFKFTSEGKVEFGYKCDGDYLRFFVKDSGIGIAPNMQEKVFNRFIQAEHDFTKNTSGTGLGLSISKALVELLGGEIELKSELNIGSEFVFTIPKKYSEEFLNNLSDSENLIVKDNNNIQTILIAEDEDHNFMFISTVLEKMGFHILRAVNGIQAIDMVQKNPDIDLILMDIKMPLLDGYSSAKQIKMLYPNLPIIAQTAYAMEHERHKYDEGAFDDYITKPIDKKELKEKIMKHVHYKS